MNDHDVERLADLCESLGLAGEDLDEEVYDCACTDASNINNRGFSGQVEYLLQYFTAEELEKIIRDAAVERKALEEESNDS